MTIRVTVDNELCAGHGQCIVYGPDVYQLDDDGYCVISNAEPSDDLRDQATDGAAACPAIAITVRTL